MVEPEELVRAEVGPSERLLWAGRARCGFIFRGGDAFLIPFALLWCGMAAYGAVTAPAWFGVLVLTVFFLVGLYMLFGRFLVDAEQRERTAYAVTSERVIIVSGLRRRVVKSLNLDTMTDITMTERRGGSGSITFGPIPPYHVMMYGGTGWPGSGPDYLPTFELAEGVRQAYETILGARRAVRHIS